MQAVIIAAGYGTRMKDGAKEILENLKFDNHPLLKELREKYTDEQIKIICEEVMKTPKPLLYKNPRMYLKEWTNDKIKVIDTIVEHVKDMEIYIVTNPAHLNFYHKYANERNDLSINVINDGYHSLMQRNGKGALRNVFDGLEQVNDHAIVLAADNDLSKVSLINLFDYFKSNEVDLLTTYLTVKGPEQLTRFMALKTNKDNRIIQAIEKPKIGQIDTNKQGVAIYILNKKIQDILKNKVMDSNDERLFQGLGMMIEKFYQEFEMHACELKGKRTDVGNIHSYLR